MTPVFTTAQIRHIEQSCGIDNLMERAGLAAAKLAQEFVADGSPVLILVGPGNNGGDALVVARLLHQAWFQVDVVFTAEAAKLPESAAAAYAAFVDAGGKVLKTIPQNQQYGLIIDGLFGIGIGLDRELDVAYVDLIDAVNVMGVPILSLDVPSGLCADSGRVLGRAIVARHTLSFLGLKPGVYTLDGPDHAGIIHCDDLGVDMPLSEGWLLDTFPARLSPRQKNSHKGDFGSLAVLGGSATMTGAALLAGRAALLTGAGRVYCGLLADNAPLVDAIQPELMLHQAETLLDFDHVSTWVVGPGMGRGERAVALLFHVVQCAVPVVLDADALHLLAQDEKIRQQWGLRTSVNVITPHPGEAAAMLQCRVAEIQSNRIASALRLAERFNAITVLKGCGSVVATPEGQWVINASGNPGLSSAGMGDVLAGSLAAFLGQGMQGLDAALLAVHLHGLAADSLVAEGIGPVGLTASELVLKIRYLLNTMVN